MHISKTFLGFVLSFSSADTSFVEKYMLEVIKHKPLGNASEITKVTAPSSDSENIRAVHSSVKGMWLEFMSRPEKAAGNNTSLYYSHMRYMSSKCSKNK